MLGAAFTARQAVRLGPQRLVMRGRLLCVAVLLLALALSGLGLSHPMALFGLTVFVGLGNGLTLANVNAGALSVRPDLAGTAAGLGGALSIALGALLSGLTALVVERWPTPGALLLLMLASVLLSLAAARAAFRRAPIA
jgi:DHA1 family bicyclomycin/chloramphenicol resistance-like MFS transporter